MYIIYMSRVCTRKRCIYVYIEGVYRNSYRYNISRVARKSSTININYFCLPPHLYLFLSFSLWCNAALISLHQRAKYPLSLSLSFTLSCPLPLILQRYTHALRRCSLSTLCCTVYTNCIIPLLRSPKYPFFPFSNLTLLVYSIRSAWNVTLFSF